MLDFLLEREFNEKCLVISGGAVLAYFVLPPRRPLVAAGVAVGTCVANAWYDQFFYCDTNLQPLGGLFGAVSGRSSQRFRTAYMVGVWPPLAPAEEGSGTGAHKCTPLRCAPR